MFATNTVRRRWPRPGTAQESTSTTEAPLAAFFTAFFAVWTVHHGCDRHHFIARTLRGKAKNLVSYQMFRHVEHHLYPAVPTCHLRELSDRLDAAAPELQTMQVF